MSFTDLMSSGRGPGLIGMLMAIVVLAGFGLLFLFAFDERFQGEGHSIESVIAGQAKEIEGMRSAITSRTKQLAAAPSRKAAAGQLSSLNREIKSRETELDGLRRSLASAKDAVAGKQSEFSAYKDQYRFRVRSQAKGTTMPRLETKKGDMYQNVSIREVNPVGMQIIHDGGHTRIGYEDLPADLQELYQFDPEQKAAAIAGEAKERALHDTAAAAAEQLADQNAELQKARNEAAARERAAAGRIAIEARITTLSDEIRNLEQALEIEVRKPLSRAPQMRQQLVSKQRELAGLQQKAASLRVTP